MVDRWVYTAVLLATFDCSSALIRVGSQSCGTRVCRWLARLRPGADMPVSELYSVCSGLALCSRRVTDAPFAMNLSWTVSTFTLLIAGCWICSSYVAQYFTVLVTIQDPAPRARSSLLFSKTKEETTSTHELRV